ncbi:hypothetical protein SAMN04488021_11669 [Paracoccus aminovorans]|uniref:J domain-containing protein n=1 Tax=Paracoccus aminovorans TaxID=34004 RepID=A0A1I3AR89_9RHOB|nr:J domain-containing protein [Paracoccus aminovorans]CQR84340.1 hypothetical protein JCM7685_pAMV3p0395 [Paracoccus aminovorans]SFH52524.1 hypothetical protein SAMN04488021_11669 [Paracoccus aminovorans]
MSDEAASWPWDVLGVAPDASQAELRRAYAVRLKALDIERQPDDFGALRAAYECARQIARQQDPAPAGPPPAGALPFGRQAHPPAQPEREAETERVPQAPRPPPPAAGNEGAAVPPPSPQPGSAARAEEPALDFDRAVKRMRAMLSDGRVNMAEWRALFGQEVLDQPEASRRFERILVEMLEARISRITHAIHAAPFRNREWLELIEDRYGWKTDGLRFQNLFPAHLDVLMHYIEMRRGVGLDPPIAALPPANPWWARLLDLLNLILRPAFFAFAAILVLLLAFGQAARTEWMRLFLGTLILVAFVWGVLPDAWKELRLPVPRLVGVGAVGQWLRRRSAAVFGLNLVVLLVVLLFAGTVVRPNLREGWISERQVFAPRPAVPSWRDAYRMIAPDRSTVERTARTLASGAIDGAEALDRMDMPYPRIAVPAPAPGTGHGEAAEDGTGDVADASLTCARSGACVMEMGVDVPVHAVVTAVKTGGSERFRLGRVTASWQGKLGEPLGASKVRPETFKLRLDPSAAAEYPTEFLPLGGRYDGTVEVHVADLSLRRGSDGAAQLRILPTRREHGALVLAGCEDDFVDLKWRNLLIVNPRAGSLVAEICSLPSDMMRLTFHASAPAVMEESGEAHVDLSQPLQRLMLGSWSAGTPGAAGKDDAVSRLALEIGDRTIQDYLTIFWSSPRPEDLDAYLQRRPQIAAPQDRPDQAALLAAARNQPHLTHAYRFRADLGTAILGDMFRYLEARGLLDS